ncbi:MAG: hypothetical protein SGJ23_10960 [Alphaproteobacteria bacterium]|nr:hypothetical protein [Alphaproteobacteria bacterium]
MTDLPSHKNVHDVPGLGERRTKALKIAGATDWWFYPLLLVFAAALVTVSLGADAFNRDGAPQKGAREAGAYIYGPAALAGGIDLANGHLRHVVRELGVSPRAVRVGVEPGRGQPTPDAVGALLQIDPADAAAFAGKPVRVEITFRRISVTTAQGLATSLQNGGPAFWSGGPIPAENGVMAFDLPALAGGPPKGLGIWVISDKSDYNYGVEITRVMMKPVG